MTTPATSGRQQGTSHCPKGRLKVPQPAPTTTSTFPDPTAQSQGHWFSSFMWRHGPTQIAQDEGWARVRNTDIRPAMSVQSWPKAWHQPLNPGSCLPYWPLNLDACLPACPIKGSLCPTVLTRGQSNFCCSYTVLGNRHLLG